MTSIPSHYTGPGLIDLQLNGYAGFDFNARPEEWTLEDFQKVRKALNRRGVLAALPTFITDDIERMAARARRYVHFLDQAPELAETFPGLHIEGPFISPEDGPRGAHPGSYCRTPAEHPDFLDRLQEASKNRVRILTLAPELDGALELIEAATRAGISVAIGHTQANANIIRQAVSAGAVMSTHLGNGSHQMLPRLDNYVQQQLAEDRLHASFIADGHHIPFATLKNFIRAKTVERSVLVTDAIAAAEVGPGRYRLGGDEVVVQNDLYVSKPGEPNLAGSALTLDKAVLHVASHCNVTFEEAWQMASVHPAALIGLKPLPEVTVDVSAGAFTAEKVLE